MKKNKFFLLYFFCFFLLYVNAYALNFDQWLEDFKEKAIVEGISKKTVEEVMSKAVFLPKVIEYDRFQPEFYEDTKTYINKRSSHLKITNGKKIFKKNLDLIFNIEEKYNVEKELLLSLMGIETNFGKYLGKMDIISSLSTLSYDERRSEFFTNELLVLLKLIDNKIIDPGILYGSWAGAFGNFQFMPSTIKNYAIDYNNNQTIELKKTGITLR